MKKVTEIRSKNLRKDRNGELLRRMKNGDQLSSFNSFSSWYPPRPIIQKDPTAIRKLYGSQAVTADQLRLVETSEEVQPLRLA